MGDLPVGWLNISLIEIAELIMGQSPPSSSYNIEGRGLPFFQGKAEFQSLYPKVIKYCDHPTKIAQTDDILLSVRAPVGPTNLCPDTSCIGRGLAAIRPKPITGHRYLLQYFRFIEPLLSQQGTGSTFQAISKKDVESIEVLLAPLNEQCRIVAKLEKLLAKVDACKERLEKIPAILKRFRQSVLAAACSGRLTADWREKNPQILPASNMIASLKTPAPENHFDVFHLSADCDLPPSWIWAPLGRMGKLDGGGTPSKSKASFWAGPIPWVSPKDMKTDRIVDSIDHISVEAISNSSAKMIPKGSILFVTRGMILNHTLPVSITDVQVTINQDMKALVPEIPDMREYLFLANKYLSTKMLFAVKEATHGTRRLESQVLKNWAIPVPPLEEQHEIVRRVEALFKIADDIEKRYQKAKAHVDKLTQSILAKAFRGELVPQDPNDEPASELLKRIQEEREKEEPEARPSRRGSRRRVKTKSSTL